MPRPTMLPPGYGYPPMHSSYSMGYQQYRHPPPHRPQFQNPGKEEIQLEHAPPRGKPQFINNGSSSEKQSSSSHETKTDFDVPPPAPSSDGTKETTKQSKAEKKPKKKASDPDDPNKKPPRSYTEYNIFFQLERERILMELEKENQTKDEGCISEKEEVVMNQPSDPNDILPRPPRFAHLKLLPKWYDSKHRLAENKKNKEKRKHRKTHGLVGFLDLTRRIAKEWSEAEDEVKAYCRRVSKRQLGYYKEELKVWKKNQESLLPDEDGKKKDVKSIKKTLPVLNASSPPKAEEMPELPEVVEKKNIKPSLPQVIHRSMPPPSTQQQYSSYRMQRNMHWQMQHPHSQTHRGYPAMPVLSPSMDYHDDYGYNAMHRSRMNPIDELMHRRKVYGSRAGQMPPSRIRKRKAEAEMPPLTGNKDMKEKVISPSEDNVKVTHSFLSPDDTGSPTNDANAAITPSPSSRSTGPQDHLPMKKRHKKTPLAVGISASDASPGSFGESPGIGPAPNDVKLSPFTFSPSDGMIMTPNEDAFMGHVSGLTPNGEAFMGHMMNESPFPYMNFSPGQLDDGVISNDVHRRSSVTSNYPNSPYMPHGSQWHQGNMPMQYGVPFDINMKMGMNPEDDFGESGDLDLDEEELQLMRRLQATRAKKIMQKQQLMQQHAVGSQDWAMAQSPGGPMLPNSSFASPLEKSNAESSAAAEQLKNA